MILMIPDIQWNLQASMTQVGRFLNSDVTWNCEGNLILKSILTGYNVSETGFCQIWKKV